MYSSISSKLYIVKKINELDQFSLGGGTKICRSATPLHQRPASIKGLSPGFRNGL